MLALLLLVAFSLRVASLNVHRFHPDEALYASWALRVQADPVLLSIPVDKPPLLMYLLAGTYGALGSSEAASRVPNVFVSVLGVALLGSIGRRVYGMTTGLITAAVYAASPFAIQFAPTVFTDPLLVMWFLLGLLSAARDRPIVAGVACGLAYATKQQAVLLIPLVVLVCALRAELASESSVGASAERRLGRWTVTLRALALLLVGFLPVFGFVLWWDSLRWHVQPSYWERSFSSYGGLGVAAASSWADRLAGWWPLFESILASPILNSLLVVSFTAALWTSVGVVWRRQRSRGLLRAGCDLLLAAFTVAYSIVHLVLAVQVWDRYLLPLVPILCLLLGRLLHELVRGLWRILGRRKGFPEFAGMSRGRQGLGHAVVVVILLALLGRPAWLGVLGRLPVGGDHGTYDGIDVLAEGAQALLPADGTLYYHDLGWHYGYYLRNAPFALVWYPDPKTLAALVCSGRANGSAIVFPSWEDDAAVRQALEVEGLALVSQFEVRHSAGATSFEFHLIRDLEDRSCIGVGT